MGSRKTKKMLDPKMPSGETVCEHEMTHVPYRNWCRHCVRGRGKEMGHRKLGASESDRAEIHMDLCFPGEEDGSKTLTVLVARARRTKMMMASVIPMKGKGVFIAKRVVVFMREIGCEQGDVTIRSDQEPAMKAIITEIGRVRAAAGGGRMVVESSPVGQSQSNGIAERGIGTVVGQVRVLRDAFETKLKVEMETNHPVIPWLVEYSTLLLNRFEVGKDGLTAFERCTGKKANDGYGVRGSGALEKKIHRWTFGEVVELVERWCVPRR